MIENTLFDMGETKRRRANYVDKDSKTGELTVHVEPVTADRIKRYCRIHNMNCKRFVNELLDERMRDLEQTQYDDLTREELVALVKRMEGRR